MHIRPADVLQFAVLAIIVAMVTAHVEILEEEDDFDYDYEDDAPPDDDKTKLKKPLPEPKNPLHEKRQFIQDKGHIKEHLKHTKMDLDNADEASVEFHFFKTHDFNEDNQLDGLELWIAIEHSIEGQIDKINNDKKLQEKARIRKISRLYWQLEATIDKILKEDDINQDGYLSYSEFANARMPAGLTSQTG